MGFRPTPRIRAELEKAARANGRSMSQEVEACLERSLREREEFGGRQLYGLLRLLVGAAEIIQVRTGKSAFDDWDTWNALQAAWNKLIGEVAPEPPPDIIRLIKKSDALQSKPVAPEFPPPPDIPNALLAGKMRLETYEKDFSEFKKRLAEHQRKFDDVERERQKLVARTTESLNLGRDVATELFPSSLNRE